VTEPSFRAVLVAFGVSQLVLAGWMVVSPESFFDSIGGFGGRNDHYIRDNAAFPFTIGIGILAAVGRPSWRVPVLIVSGVWYLAHSVNHLVDIGESDPDWAGPVDFVVILVTGLTLLLLAALAARSEASGRP
jgi:hypothetical protein